MKKSIKIIFSVIGTCTVSYLGLAFVYCSFNPCYYPTDVKGGVFISCSIISLLKSLVIHIDLETKYEALKSELEKSKINPLN